MNLPAYTPFHGSYAPEDVAFLLKVIDLPMTPVAEKERRIQSGQSHYSEMLSKEKLPSKDYLDLFYSALKYNRKRFSHDIALLAKAICLNIKTGPITLVSLARAGTPVGVLLKHTLVRHCQRDVQHYSISIIRDRGIDTNALLYILEQAGRPEESLVFVDGWTGKGVIQAELNKAIAIFNAKYGTALNPGLYVVTDLCGAAHTAAGYKDYLIPSGILNATISGLISRSILNSQYTSSNDFHACVYYDEFIQADLSHLFVQSIMRNIDAIVSNIKWTGNIRAEDKKFLQDRSNHFMQSTMQQYSVRQANYLKPGIGEATRVLLRRTPDLLLLHDRKDQEIQHLLVLAEEKQIPIKIHPDLPYKAAALIKDLLF